MDWRQAALQRWGKWVCSHLEFPDELGENILYDMIQYGTHTDGQVNGSAILCADMPPKIMQVHRAYNKLDELRKKCLWLKYCSPTKENGQLYTKAEFAHSLRINKGKFRAELRKAEHQIKSML